MTEIFMLLIGAVFGAVLSTQSAAILKRLHTAVQRKKQPSQQSAEEQLMLHKQYANLLCYDGTKEGQLNLED